ncbi:MAG: DUF3883 domain-containing protein [Lentisphaeria bacterium]|jgi:hypothetical protein
MRHLNSQEILILCGLYLSKYDRKGLGFLGFKSFKEAFNTFAFSIGKNPSSIKLYRDEFDPYFQNQRRGFIDRKMRSKCQAMMAEFGALNLGDLAMAIKVSISQLGEIEEVEGQIEKTQSFAKRMQTGQAAEEYFRQNYQAMAVFVNHNIMDCTKLGCGFDFKLTLQGSPYVAVEVKGLSAAKGSLSLSANEYRTASILADRYFLYVVTNFVQKPKPCLFQHPCQSIHFSQQKMIQEVETWTATI